MTQENTPLGLRGQHGCRVLDQIIEHCGEPSEVFRNTLEEMWGDFSGVSGPGQGKWMYPEDKARQFLLERLLPVTNKNHETECYFLLNVIKHLNQQMPHFQEGEYDPFSPGSDDPEYDLFKGGSMSFYANRRRAIVDCLHAPDVTGTVLEKYLRYPIETKYSGTKLFSIEGSQASRRWANTPAYSEAYDFGQP